MTNYAGEIAAFATSICWTVTALCFEDIAKKIGSLALNIQRLIMALTLFIITGLILRGEVLPFSLAPRIWFWLFLSGLVGFFFADIFFFQAYVDIGARLTQVITICSPISSAILGYFVLGEKISLRSLAGIGLVLASIIFVLTAPPPGPKGQNEIPANKRLRARGVLFAVLAGLGQSVGLILSKIGAPEADPLAATQIRTIAGLTGFTLFLALTGKLKKSLIPPKEKKTLGILTLGVVTGPFIGVTLSLFAMQKTGAGIAATLMNLIPIMILLPEFLIYKKPVTLRELTGAAGAVIGAALIFL